MDFRKLQSELLDGDVAMHTHGVVHELVTVDAIIPSLNGRHVDVGLFVRSQRDAIRLHPRCKPADYDHSGYDQGHQAPADDFGWDIDVMRDSSSMANMAPQLPGLNRAEWERLEEDVRSWAWKRGALIVYVGPVLKAHSKTIGADHVAVPIAFWKVVLDVASGEALAFEMPQKAINKGDVKPWETTVAAVEQVAGIKLPLPAGVDRGAVVG